MEKKYPYLAHKIINEKQIVVLFSDENYGTVLLSEITNNPDYAFGAINEFDERTFEVLPPDRQVSLHN